MEDILKVIDDLRNRLWAKYGNPLAKYKKTQNDVHMTYYVGRLMDELGHKDISPKDIRGEHEDRCYYSERALHDAFLAGQLLAKADNKVMRESVLDELKAVMIHSIESY
jgi:hypothetical protein